MRVLFSAVIMMLVIIASAFSVNAGTYDELLKDNGASEIINQLPDNAKNSLNDIGLKDFNFSELKNLKPENILSSIFDSVKTEGKAPLKTLTALTAVLLLYSILYGMGNTLDGTLKPVMSVAVTICLSCAIVVPITGFITSAVDTIKISSNFMISYIPLMALVMSLSGQPLSGAGYYGIMLFAGQAVSRASSEIIAPFMKIFLAVSVASSVSPNINLGGIVRSISKTTKITLAFIMSIFTGILSFKQVISAGADSLSSRAVRFSLSSFVPMVGSALSEAYRTVQGSVGLLKSGVGITAILAVCAVYMPVIVQCLFWMLILGVSKTVSEVLNLREPCVLLESVYTVVSTIFAVILSLTAVFIISAAVVLMAGGAG